MSKKHSGELLYTILKCIGQRHLHLNLQSVWSNIVDECDKYIVTFLSSSISAESVREEARTVCVHEHMDEGEALSVGSKAAPRVYHGVVGQNHEHLHKGEFMGSKGMRGYRN